MTNYSIRKINNNNYREINKEFSLDVNEYCKDSKNLYFHVNGEANPTIIDFWGFYQTTVEQIGSGLIESMEYDDGLLLITERDGSVIKNYLYDFHWNQFANRMKAEALDSLKKMVVKIVSFYNDNPYRESLAASTYLLRIFDILDADRSQNIGNPEEAMRILKTYQKFKPVILTTLLNRVVFYDDKNRTVDYNSLLRKRKLNQIKLDVLNQMEITMMLFAGINGVSEEYKAYLSKIDIPRRHILLQAYDEEGNVIGIIDPTQKGTIFSMGKELAREAFGGLKQLTLNGVQKIGDKINGKGRTR